MAHAPYACDGMGIGPIMVAFEAGIAPILDLAGLVLGELTPPEVSVELAAAFAAGPAMPAMLFTMSQLEWIDLAASLPPLPAPFEGLSGLDLPGWDVTVHGLALIGLIDALITLPIDLMLGITDIELPITPEVVVAFLPIAATLPGLQTCVTEKLAVLGG